MNRKCFFVLVFIVGLLWLYTNQIVVVRYVENEDFSSTPISKQQQSENYVQHDPHDGLHLDDHMVCAVYSIIFILRTLILMLKRFQMYLSLVLWQHKRGIAFVPELQRHTTTAFLNTLARINPHLIV